MIQGEPVVVVDGCRTPFARSGTDFTDLSAYDLGCAAVAGLLHRTRIDPDAVDLMVMGTVIADPATSNLGREVGLGAGLPATCPAYTVTMACVSSLQAILDGVRAIACGDAGLVVAAGAETLSDAPIRYKRPVRKRLIAAQKARGTLDYLRLMRGLSLVDLAPDPPAIAEFSTGETMGQNGERLAKRLGITREAQDAFALASHRRAAKAWEDGHMARQVVPVYVPPKCRPVTRDNGVRGDSTMEQLGRLKPAFDRAFGTITAANASYLTDGASAVLLASESRAPALGLEPRAYIRAAAVAASDPQEELLLGPAFTIPRVLLNAGLSLDDVGVLELHEAFAAQLLAVVKVLGDDEFARTRLSRDRALGTLDPDRLNAWGGSLSVGHPFGATGARLVTTCTQRMEAEDARFGLVSACAAGALGIAMVLERP